MKKNKIVILLLISSFICMFISCKKAADTTPASNNNPSPAYTCATCNGSPEAIAANDNSSAGVYKGVIVGSSGVFKLVINNGNSTISGLALVDGVTYTLTSSLTSYTTGQSLNNVVFKGTQNGITVQITLNANSYGGNLTASITITGHSNVKINVVKETSIAIIKCYEGTFSGSASGAWNFIIQNNKIQGTYKPSGSSGSSLDGTQNGTSIGGNLDGGTWTGTFTNSDYLTGTWKDNKSSDNGSWTGKRTL
jgi:hypothetical protein